MKPKDEQKHQRLLTAAITILAAGGLANFSTTKVAKLAGIPQSNVYIYFENKQALLAAVYQTTVHQQSVAVTGGIATDASVADQLAASVQGLYQFALTHGDVATVIRLLTGDQQFKTTLAAKLADPENQQIQALLQRGITQEILRPVAVDLLRYFLTDPVYRYADMVRAEQINATPEGLRQLTAMVLGAVLRPTSYQDWLTRSAPLN